ncbi:hypothetical protein BHE74_00023447 [Ensete ventricosum]|nr:hypothetical protein BHE74_00023447 [Ensete ventricosum]RZR89711.1 hypothetical protein BHM03_00017484 [Ensete ventricosum]
MNWWMFSRLQDTPIRLLRRNPGASNVSVVSLSRPSILVPFFFLHSYIYLAESYVNVINGHYSEVSYLCAFRHRDLYYGCNNVLICPINFVF